jgi:hypothetical protein
MKTAMALFIVLGLNVTSLQADDSLFYQNTAQSILDTIQTKANHLTAEESAALAILNSHNDMPEIPQSHVDAEALLSKSFQSVFVQPDDVVGPIKTQGTLFGGPRDLYTYCPAGLDVKRHLSQDIAIGTNEIENIFSGSFCATPDLTNVEKAVRVQDLWISNVKHPLLTLLIVTDEQVGQKTNLDIDLNQLVAGQIFEAQILKAISPKN